jgi:hypothetical protein
MTGGHPGRPRHWRLRFRLRHRPILKAAGQPSVNVSERDFISGTARLPAGEVNLRSNHVDAHERSSYANGSAAADPVRGIAINEESSPRTRPARWSPPTPATPKLLHPDHVLFCNMADYKAGMRRTVEVR